MAKGQKKTNREARKPKSAKTVQKTIIVPASEQMKELMHGGGKKK